MDDSAIPHGPSQQRPPIYQPTDPPPPYDPPSYEYATQSSSTPLLGGVPRDYGTYRAYPDLEAGSVVSSDAEEDVQSLPEWVGQALVVVVFLSIIYGFWEFVVHGPDFVDFPD